MSVASRQVLKLKLWRKKCLNGKWQMANGKWQMANGKWQMANGKWLMVNGKWQMSEKSSVVHERLEIGTTILLGGTRTARTPTRRRSPHPSGLPSTPLAVGGGEGEG